MHDIIWLDDSHHFAPKKDSDGDIEKHTNIYIITMPKNIMDRLCNEFGEDDSNGLPSQAKSPEV